MKKNDSGLSPAVVWGIIGITVVIFGGIIISSITSKGVPIQGYQIQDTERPALEMAEAEKNFDFGTMKVSEIKTKDIEIKNAGKKPLIISDILTSCDCTFVQLVIGGVESQKFSMQRDAKWRGEIQPDSSAIVKVIYEPRIMPVKGKVERSVFFKTNDPANPAVTINFSAFVD